MSIEPTALAVIERSAELDRFMPLMSIETGLERREILVRTFQKLMKAGEDFGIIPGSKKPTLLQPGAQKLDNLFGLVPRFELIDKVEDWTGADHGGEPFFRYMVRCQVMRGDFIMGESIGECNSWEPKYRYRNADRICPKCKAAAIIFTKRKSFWCAPFKGGCGVGFKEDDATITGQEIGRKLNPDICEQVNTLLKLAQKRGHMGATINATSASEFVTQDLEDRAEYAEPQQEAGVYVASAPQTATAAQSTGAAPPAAPARPVPEELMLVFEQIDKGDKTVIGPLFATYERELTGIYGTVETTDGILAPGLDIYKGIVMAARKQYPRQIPLTVIKEMLIDLQLEVEKAEKARGQKVADEITGKK